MNSPRQVVYEFGEFRLEPRRRLLVRAGERVALTGKPYDALVFLVEHAGELVTRTALADALWPQAVVEENNLTQAIAVLRRVLGEDSIATVARRGYQFTAEVRAETTATESPVSPEPGVLQRPVRAASWLALAGAVVAVAAASLWFIEYRQGSGVPEDPLEGYSFTKLTEFEGSEEHAAISGDGRFVAFLREQAGSWDAWVGEVGTGAFRNLTEGTTAELRNPNVRTLVFQPDGSHVIIWTRAAIDGGIVNAGLAFPTMGGPPQAYLNGIAELDWSTDGRRIAYHTAAAGDPLFVADSEVKGEGRQIYIAEPGVHNHFPLWSQDGEFIYFVRGFVPDEMDVWRIRGDGGQPERLTFHNSSVSFPIRLDRQTLLYLATAPDGTGPWLHSLDLKRGGGRRLETRGQEYASLAASADGQRIVATEVRRTAALWQVPLRNGGAREQDARRLEIPTPRGESPRIGAGFIVFRAPKAGTDGMWKIADGVATELWSGVDGRVVAGPAISPDSRRIAFPVQRQGHTRLQVIDVDGANVRQLAGELDVRGAPAWSPDGRWIAIGALRDDLPRLFKIPVDGGEPVALGEDFAINPAWSPSGRFLVFAGADVGTNFAIGAVNADGSPRKLATTMLSRGSGRFDFLSEDEIVVLKGNLSQKNFWVLDLRDGRERMLTRFEAGTTIRDFDVADDGSEIFFDRVRAESDIVLMERPRP